MSEPDDDNWTTICPKCGYSEWIDAFDCMGADKDKVFCPQCDFEFDPTEKPEGRLF